MEKKWRPDRWARQRNDYFEDNQPKPPYYKSRQLDYEAGADAILGALRQQNVTLPDIIHHYTISRLGKLAVIPNEVK